MRSLSLWKCLWFPADNLLSSGLSGPFGNALALLQLTRTVSHPFHRNGFEHIDSRGSPVSSSSVPVADAQRTPCPPGSCEAHWERRGRVVPECREGLGLCKNCFSGRPLPPALELDEHTPRRRSLGSSNADETKPQTELVSIGRAAEVLGVSLGGVIMLCEVGRIRGHFQSSRGWLVDRESLCEWLDAVATARDGDRESSDR